MKIDKISITNYRSIKDTQTVENIQGSLIFTGINNSGKSSFLNAIAVFLCEKPLVKEDFHKGEDEISINITFNLIEDAFLVPFCDKRLNQGDTTLLKEQEDIFSSYPNNKIDYKKDFNELSNEQKKYLEGKWLEEFKSANGINQGVLTVESKFTKDNLKGAFTGGNSIKPILPKPIFIDDERNFENEEYGGTGSITKKFFEGKELNEFDDPPYDIETIKEKRGEELSIYELGKLLILKGGEITESMQRSISDNFQEYYNTDYRIEIEPNTSIAHKNFSLETKVIDPNIGKVPLSKVGAGLRALYLLSLLKAYNDSNLNLNAIFLIEEPELYLHPGLQKQMASTLESISENQQVFFTTHSPILLKNFDLLSIKEVRKERVESLVVDANFNDIISNLGFSLFDIIKYKYLIFVEGRDDHDVLKKIIHKFYSQHKDKVEIITSNGCGNLAYYASLKFLGLTNHSDIKYLILRDKDNKDEGDLLDEFRSSLEEKDINAEFIDELLIKFKILDRYSIENFFLEEEIIKTIEPTYSETIFKADLLNFIETKDSSLQNKQPEIYNDIEQLINNDFDGLKLSMRGHNMFNALLFHIRKNSSVFFEEYINNSAVSDFGIIKESLDELFAD